MLLLSLATHQLSFSLVLGRLASMMLCMVWGAATVWATTGTPRQEASPPQSEQENWAEAYLADDPLAAKTSVTLAEIQAGLDDPKRRGEVISRHFAKVSDLPPEDQTGFLRQLLESEFPEIQLQAAQELANRNELVAAIRDRLLRELRSEQPSRREAAMVGLSQLKLSPTELPPEYTTALAEALASERPDVAAVAASSLRESGMIAVPLLLRRLNSDQPQAQLAAARLLGEIAAQTTSERAPPRATEYEPPAELMTEAMPPPVVPKAAAAAEPVRSIRQPDPAAPQTVTVYYGTNREQLPEQAKDWSELVRYPALIAVLLAALGFSVIRVGKNSAGGCGTWLLSLVLLVGIVWSGFVLRGELETLWRIDPGPNYGPRRSTDNQIHYGTCEVSLPPSHVIGEVERPAFGLEDENLHVVIKKTEELEADAYFQLLRERLEQLPAAERSCFVFIHGFNVDFANAARRTAQIHHDLKFKGLPIFFSWPSRASIRHYFSDRNEIAFSRFVIKQFLLDISERVQAERIHVIAHSMGADATCQAIAELGERGRIFDQIILAAPDIDRDVFRYQLAPRMAAAGQRTTLYCSKNDLALIASKAFNDGPRAGDSSRGALVTKEIDTVDASEIDTDLLGHSYYGDCLPLLEDVQKLLGLHLPPAERQLKPWPVDNQLLYWTLPDKGAEPESAAPGVAPAEVPTTPEK